MTQCRESLQHLHRGSSTSRTEGAIDIEETDSLLDRPFLQRGVDASHGGRGVGSIENQTKSTWSSELFETHQRVDVVFRLRTPHRSLEHFSFGSERGRWGCSGTRAQCICRGGSLACCRHLPVGQSKEEFEGTTSTASYAEGASTLQILLICRVCVAFLSGTWLISMKAMLAAVSRHRRTT